MVSWSKVLGLASITAATALLGLVAFDVPYFKSVYFLKMDIPNNGTPANPFVILGVLGYCTDLQDGKGLQCSPAHVGYSLADASQFLNGTGLKSLSGVPGSLPNGTIPGNTNLPPGTNTTNFIGTLDQTGQLSDAANNIAKLPDALNNSVNTISAALTKVLVVHIIAFGIALISLAFAILAFLGAPIVDRCSSCFCGFAGSATLAVMIFDVVFFVIIKKRVDQQVSGTTKIGSAVFLTAIAMLLLFITPILFLIGRCCACCFSCGSRK
ncbi:actin cortical patch SUR7/pH-response regulator pali [Mycena rebaudengoi]|nr:actin cortical patch SUR7/pH-response regulator pali [Mycena rebaudengoi]